MALALLLHLALTASAAMGQYSSTTTFSFTGNTLPTGLVKSYWDVAECDNDNAKYNRLFEEQNVQVRDGFMDLIVPGGQTTSPIRSAEVGTEFEVLYGSVRTYAILTDEPGVCNGLYHHCAVVSTTQNYVRADLTPRHVHVLQCEPGNGY